MKSKILSFVFLMLITQAQAQRVSLIPEPIELTWRTESFALTGNTPIVVTQGLPDMTRISSQLSDRIFELTKLRLKPGSQNANGIQLVLDPAKDQQLGNEGYLLEITGERVTITGNTPAGIFYGVQTLTQLIPFGEDQEVKLQGVRIRDYPRFAWRGIMLDVSRHFFPKEYVKQFIDQIARYKFNRFHWHLTDDNGWRVEIKSLPKLTEVGAWRVPRVGTFNWNDPPKPGEKPTDGGFYTQDDIREVVRYAQERYVEILPEIDVPGHSMAAVAAYPELSVTNDTVNVDPGTEFATWHDDGTFTMHVDNTLDPTDENVYRFLDKVFGELATLFPFEYIHIGGDECYKGYWERDPRVQAFMKKNKLANGAALQGYFTKRVASIVINKKKKVIGWDEIIESPMPAGVDVMSWRGTKGGIEAAHQKRNVVMTPNPVYYLDMCQGESSIEPPIYNKARLKEVYDHKVIPEGVEASFIMGGQGSLWTEQTPTTAQVEYMVYPRALAMAESFWSDNKKKDWRSFVQKVEDHFVRLDSMNVNYSPAMYDPIISVKEQEGKLQITLEAEVPGITIHYTYDNTVPNKYSPAYNGEPIVYPPGADNFRVTSYRNGKPIGRLISFTTEALQKRLKK